jgi:hypothetical protein
MIAVLLFITVTGSLKQMMIGQVTDSVLGHIEVHRKGYVASVDNLPLSLNMKPADVAKVETAPQEIENIETGSPRVKFGGMFSNFAETTSIRVNGVDPERETATVTDETSSGSPPACDRSSSRAARQTPSAKPWRPSECFSLPAHRWTMSDLRGNLPGRETTGSNHDIDSRRASR